MLLGDFFSLLSFPNVKLRSSSYWETKSHCDEEKRKYKRNPQGINNLNKSSKMVKMRQKQRVN